MHGRADAARVTLEVVAVAAVQLDLVADLPPVEHEAAGRPSPVGVFEHHLRRREPASGLPALQLRRHRAKREGSYAWVVAQQLREVDRHARAAGVEEVLQMPPGAGQAVHQGRGQQSHRRKPRSRRGMNCPVRVGITHP